MDYETTIDILSLIVRKAGKFILNNASLDVTSKNKTNAKDFVTVADIKSQDILTKELKAVFPELAIISEEHDKAERQRMFSPDFTGFVIDPIDGTYNFKRGMKESAISIGLIEQGTSMAGVVFDPYRNELFSAVKGKGAKMNGKTITVSTQENIEGSSVATSNSYDDEAMARNLRRHLLIYTSTGHMPWTSCPGSGVLIMAWVACGRIDAYHHNGLKPWDNAAAFLLVQEAGGIVQKLNLLEGAGFTDTTILMGTPEIVKDLRDVFDRLKDEALLS